MGGVTLWCMRCGRWDEVSDRKLCARCLADRPALGGPLTNSATRAALRDELGVSDVGLWPYFCSPPDHTEAAWGVDWRGYRIDWLGRDALSRPDAHSDYVPWPRFAVRVNGNLIGIMHAQRARMFFGQSLLCAQATWRGLDVARDDFHVSIEGLRRPHGKSDLTRANKGADLLMAVATTLGRPPDSGYFSSPAECQAALMKAISYLLDNDKYPSQEAVAEILCNTALSGRIQPNRSGPDARRVRDWLVHYGLPPWEQMVKEVRARLQSGK